MAKSTARTGKLKRSKARKEPATPAEPTREATVGELLAALERPSVADVSAGGSESDEFGLAGFEDDTSQDLPAAPKPPPPAEGEEGEDGVQLSDTLPMAPEDDLSRVRGQASPRLMSVVESLLFASNRPLTVRDIRKVLREPTVRQVQLALKQLQAETASRGVVLSQVAGGFRLRTHPANAKWVQKMLAGKPARLSRSQLEALAVIAYRQPITKAEIDHVRGVDCGAVLRVLLERDLARIVGRKEEPGRPHLYGTTVEFLEFFNLRSLRDMPDLHEFRELTDESRATLRSEMGEDADELEAEVLGQEVLDFDGEAAGSEAEAPTEDVEQGNEEPAGDEASAAANAEDSTPEDPADETEARESEEASEASEAETEASAAESEPEAEVEPEAEAESEAEAEAEAESEAEVEPEAEVEAEAEAEAEAEVESEAEVEPEAEVEAEAEAEVESEAEVEPEAEVEAEAEAEPEADGDAAEASAAEPDAAESDEPEPTPAHEGDES